MNFSIKTLQTLKIRSAANLFSNKIFNNDAKLKKGIPRALDAFSSVF